MKVQIMIEDGGFTTSITVGQNYDSTSQEELIDAALTAYRKLREPVFKLPHQQ